MVPLGLLLLVSAVVLAVMGAPVALAAALAGVGGWLIWAPIRQALWGDHRDE